MVQGHSVTEWLDQLRAGDSAAATPLWNRYVERLIRLADHKLGRLPRRPADEEDVALSAFHDFVQGVREGRFGRLNDRHDLWQILVLVTERKAIGMIRRERAERRGMRQVNADARLDSAARSDHGLDHLPSREPTPEFAAEVRDQLRRLLDSLHEEQRQVALAKLEGCTNPEIAAQLQMSLRSVERKLAIIRRKWQRHTET